MRFHGPRQEQLLETLGKMKKDGKMIMIEGARQTIDLVSDTGGWKVFLGLGLAESSHTQIRFSSVCRVEARFVQNELIVKKTNPSRSISRSKTGANDRLWRGSFITLSRGIWKIILT
mgnify:CR=1 FL=1